eukprot:6489030-Amphidinium_carterae.2
MSLAMMLGQTLCAFLLGLVLCSADSASNAVTKFSPAARQLTLTYLADYVEYPGYAQGYIVEYTNRPITAGQCAYECTNYATECCMGFSHGPGAIAGTGRCWIQSGNYAYQ